jgi:ABC-type multidrug transport system fused ATPase/permease subunit
VSTANPQIGPTQPTQQLGSEAAYSGGGRGIPPGASDPKEFGRVPGRLSELRYYYRYLKPVRSLVVALLIAGIAVNLFRAPVSLVPLLLTRYAGNPTLLYGLLGGVVLCILAMGAAMVARGYWGGRLGEHLLRNIRNDLYARLEGLSMRSLSAQGTGPLSQRLARDVYYIRDLFDQTFIQVVDESSRFVVCGLMCVWLDPKLSAFLFVLFVAVWPFVRLVNRKVESLARENMVLGEKALAQLVESIGGFRDILASGRFETFSNRFGELLGKSEKVGVRTTLWEQLAVVIPRTWISLLLVLPYALLVGGMDSVENIGTVVTYVLLVQQILPVVGVLAHSASQLARATPSMREIRLILENEEPEPHAIRSSEPNGNGQPGSKEPLHSIRFENVSLELGGGRILDDISFEIPEGKFTAIIGQSGAGKTTLFHLMLRLIEPTEGSIYLNGTPLDRVGRKRIRQIFGFIPQNPFIFNQSLRDNLLLSASEEGNEEALARAVEISQLNEVVENRRHEGGLAADAGYLGANLSGGEKQRIALARLILQDPEVIVCDEYTANIDIKTATLIQEAMRTLFAGRTRVIISHELYTVKGADHIVVLDRGKVVQTGTHEELVARDGMYRTLWEMQTLT